jgi:LemA protein
MKRSRIILIGAIAAVFIIFMMYRSSYNKAIGYQENVDEKWGNVSSAYQRRADLVPQLIATVEGAAKNEQKILIKVTEARSGMVGVADEIANAKNPEQLQMLGKKINTAINLAYEAYPQIRSTENFSALQNQLEGTENRIKLERDRYNESIKEYNTHIRGFFNSMFLNASTFPKKKAFKNDPGAEKATEVKFNL